MRVNRLDGFAARRHAVCEQDRRGFNACDMIFLATTLLCGLASAAGAKPFKCPHVGGDLVFGQEANINTLDQMTSATISTRNIAMNIYETLMTRDENNNPILELASRDDRGAGSPDLHVQVAPGHRVP